VSEHTKQIKIIHSIDDAKALSDQELWRMFLGAQTGAGLLRWVRQQRFAGYERLRRGLGWDGAPMTYQPESWDVSDYIAQRLWAYAKAKAGET